MLSEIRLGSSLLGPGTPSYLPTELLAESTFAVPTPESFGKKVKTKKRGGGEMSAGGGGPLLVSGVKKSRPGGAGLPAGSQCLSMITSHILSPRFSSRIPLLSTTEDSSKEGP